MSPLQKKYLGRVKLCNENGYKLWTRFVPILQNIPIFKTQKKERETNNNNDQI